MGDHPAISEDKRAAATLASAKASMVAPKRPLPPEYLTIVEFSIGEMHFVKPMHLAIQVLKEHAQWQMDIVLDHMRRKNDPFRYLFAVVSEVLSGAENLIVIGGWAASAGMRVEELERGVRKYPDKPEVMRERLVLAVESINRCKRALVGYRNDVIVGADRGVIATEILIGIVVTVYTGGLGVGVLKGAAIKVGFTAGAGFARAASEKWLYNLRDDIPVGKILADSGVACASSMLGGAWSKSFKDYMAKAIAERGIRISDKIAEKLVEEAAEGLVELIAAALTSAFSEKESFKGDDAVKVGVGAVLEAIVGVVQ